MHIKAAHSDRPLFEETKNSLLYHRTEINKFIIETNKFLQNAMFLLIN